MHNSDQQTFVRVLDEQAAIFGKPKPTDELIQTYWRALKDLSLQTVQDCATRHSRYGKFFPKPVELRPREDKPPGGDSAEGEAKFRSADARSRESWDAMRRENPAEQARLLRSAAIARLELLHPEGHSRHAEVKRLGDEDALEHLRWRESQWTAIKATEIAAKQAPQPATAAEPAQEQPA